jgi:hypothetical protein
MEYPLILYYDAASPECAARVERLRSYQTAGRLEIVASTQPGIHARDAAGRCWVGIVALEAAYRAAWAGKVPL